MTVSSCGSVVFLPCVLLIFRPISHQEEIVLCNRDKEFCPELHYTIVLFVITHPRGSEICISLNIFAFQRNKLYVKMMLNKLRLCSMFTCTHLLIYTTKLQCIHMHSLYHPEPGPPTKLLLFHCTQGKWKCTQPLHIKSYG